MKRDRALIAIYEAGISHLVEICTAAASGDLERRARDITTLETALKVAADGCETGKPELTSGLQELADALNHVLDMSDAYLRESQAALKAARDDRFYRKFLERGFLGSFADGARSIQEASTGMQKAADARTERDLLAGEFENRTARIVETLAASATETQSSAHALARSAGYTANAVAEAATSSATMAQRMSEVAGHGAQVARAADSIGESAVSSLAAAATAKQAAQEAVASANNLDHCVGQVDSVITLIRQIASQSNILALNAAVEAARAGDAGRSFAVVAEEVRNLALQTADATHKVSATIVGIQDSSRLVSRGIDRMAAGVKECEVAAQAIAVSAEEQHGLTSHMEQGLRVVAEMSTSLSTGMDRSSQTVAETTTAADEVLAVATELASTAESLDDILGGFLGALRKHDTVARAESGPVLQRVA